MAGRGSELWRLLESDDARVRLDAALVLARLGDVHGIPALLAALDDPRQPAVVREAVMAALAALPTAASYSAVERALNDRDRLVRRAARRCLRRCGSASSRRRGAAARRIRRSTATAKV